MVWRAHFRDGLVRPKRRPSEPPQTTGLFRGTMGLQSKYLLCYGPKEACIVG
jgi:hypothetical protein